MAQLLNVWMNGVLVGAWTSTRGGGTQAFRYDSTWRTSSAARVLSLSLPFTSAPEIRGEVVNNYFDNLLPDSPTIRQRLGSRFKAKSGDAFDLLTAIGRDCVGAVQLLPDTMQPAGWNRIEARPMSEDDIERHLRMVTSSEPLSPGDVENDFRLSIAGAQEKTALLRIGGQWHRPLGATPTTHIVKLPMGLVGNMRADMSQSVENEWLCSQIVQELGLAIARTEMASFGAQRALVVERFDRQWQGAEGEASAWIARLPQEDICQALGLPSRLKYQSHGGPGIEDVLRLLTQSATAVTDRNDFLKAQFVFWLLAATDGHAKNFSIHHRRGREFGMTPLYDVLSAWPLIGKGTNQLAYQDAKLAMAVRSKSLHYRLGALRVRHWQAMADRQGAPDLEKQLIAIASGVNGALQRVQARLPADFPPAIWDPIAQGVKRHATQFIRELTLTVRASGSRPAPEGR